MCSVLCTGVRASDEFSTDLDVTYKVNESGITEVINKVTLTNLFSNLYATSYSIVLDSINPASVKGYSDQGLGYSVKTTTDGDKTTLRVEFPDTVVGKDKSRTFYISFEESSFAVRTGEVWEISIPRLSEDATFNSYNLNLQIPEKLGLEAYISPVPREKSNVNGYLTYNFSKADVEKTGITAGFGAFQVFSFTLNYHLENPLAKSAKTEITIPPDTAYQKVYYSNISPKPTNMTIDSDGNWIAEYTLSPRERVDVTAVGHVQIFSNYRPFQKPTDESLNQNLLQSDYWDTTNPEIVRLANELKTPKAIYDYVSQTLKYDYARVRPNVERLGAVRALDNPTSAICMEFTDLFVAISRAAGIPAREVNGYAYTENPEIQPLSLVNDVLHAWPEYYDKDKGVWIPVDPTWGSTTGGVDYFSKLDLRHFTFVAHGKDAVKPYPAGSYKLGSNPQKDVFVSFGSLPEVRNSNLEVTANIEGWIPLISNRLNIKITNPGPSAVYKVIPNIYFDGVKKEANINILELLPFQESKSIVEIPFSFLGINTPNIVKVEVLGEEVIIPTNKKHVIIYNLLFIFVVTILILVTIMFRLKKWKFPKKSS
jgi:transglutaminase-like putative cysteine protease